MFFFIYGIIKVGNKTLDLLKGGKTMGNKSSKNSPLGMVWVIFIVAIMLMRSNKILLSSIFIFIAIMSIAIYQAKKLKQANSENTQHGDFAKNRNSIENNFVEIKSGFNKEVTNSEKLSQQRYERPNKHNRITEDQEKMSKEDRDNYRKYKNTKDAYEQTIRPVRMSRKPGNQCGICRNFNEPNANYCEVCSEFLGDGLKCTFCNTKNEMGSKYCKNCGVKFV